MTINIPQPARGLSLLFCFAALSLAAWGQEVTATITGTVTDSSGAVVAGAAVSAQEVDRGTLFSSKTNSAGIYNLPQLHIGTYDVKVEASGFATAEHPPITLVLNQTARLDFRLSVGQASQTVTVSSAQPLLQTDSTLVGTVISGRANVALPLATRNYNQLTLLSPGAVSTNPGSFTGPQATFQSGRPYINGNREQVNNYILDGMDNNQIDNNDVAYAPSVDSIQEFNLISQNAPASFGNYLGGVISVSTKSGTNQFHGDIFEFIRNDKLNANTWSNNLQGLPRADLRWNEFGGSIGGPIIRDKLFFFADYQGSRFDQPATPTPYTVFTAAERQGDFSQFCTSAGGTFQGGICSKPAGQLYNPRSSSTVQGRQPFLNNQIPASLFNASAVKILSSPLYPEPLNAQNTGNQVNLTHSYTNGDQGDLRIDWAATAKDHVYGRYSQQSVVNPTTNSQLLTGDSENNYPIYNGLVSWSRTIGPSLVNEVRFGVSYYPVTLGVSNPVNQNLPQVFGVAGVTPGITLLPQMQITGGFVNTTGNALGNNDAVNKFDDTVIQAEDSIILTRGRHSFNIGFQYFRYRTDIFYPGNGGLAGQIFFNGQFTGNGAATNAAPGMGEADFLLGLPNQIALGGGSGDRGLRNSLMAAYLQDDWRIASNLTLNLGLRWELNTPRSEVHNQETNYGLYSGAVMIAGVGGNSSSLYNQYNGPTNFQPRVGLTWQPSWDKNTVVRAGYGISNFAESTGTNNLLFQNPPFIIPHNVLYNNTQALPGSTLDQGFSQFPTSGCTVAAALQSSPLCFKGAGIHAFDPNFRAAVSQQYNFIIQRQLNNSMTFQIGYVGQKTDHLAAIGLLNQGVLASNGTVSPSPYLAGNPTLKSEIGQPRVTESNGLSNYNAMQATLQKRLSNGLETQLNYTWSKCMADAAGFFYQYGDTNPGLTQAGDDYTFFQNQYDPKGDYGRCFNDVASDFNGYVLYDLPFGRGRMFGSHLNPVVNAIAGGWQINSLFTFHTGFPVTAQANDQSGTGSGFPRANCVGQPIETPYKQSTIAGSPGYQWLGQSSVTTPNAGTFGDCQVGSFRGPGLKTADLAVSKSFPITESQNVEFRAEAINFTNTPILAAPSDRVGPTFGLVTQSQGPRNIQFALKYHF